MFNVALITVDSLRADHVGCVVGLNKSESLTPNLDQWTQRAFVFSSAISQSSHTSPSFLAMLSGCYPCAYGDWFASLSEKRTTIAEILKHNGYDTGAFLSNPYISRAADFNRGFDFFEDNFGKPSTNRISRRIDLAMLRLKTFLREPYQTAEHINGQVFSWLDKATRPYFVWVHYMDVHGPYIPETHFSAINRIRAGYIWKKALSKPEKIDNRAEEFLKKTYAQKVKDIDSRMIQLLEKLDHNNTIIIITADHGDLLGEHGLFGHPLELYDELLRVPLVVCLPPDLGFTPSRIEKDVQSIDIVPTILDLLGFSSTNHLHGASLVNYMRNCDNEYLHKHLISEVSRQHLCVRKTPWKAILNYSRELKAIYNLVSDPHELTNIASQQPEILKELEEVALAHIEKYRLDDTQIQAISDDERIRAQLKALGYMD